MSLKTYAEAKAEALSYYEGRWNGSLTSLKTPWRKYNNIHIDGMEWHTVVTICGLSGSGKSSVVNQLEREVFLLNPNEDFIILNFNFEMPAAQIIKRSTVASTGIDNKTLSNAANTNLTPAIKEEVRRILSPNSPNLNIYYCEYPQSVEQYKAICREFYRVHRKKIMVITDHSILFKKAANEKEINNTLYNLSSATLEIKKEMPIIQIHLSQLNREILDSKRRVPNSPLNYPSNDCIFGGDALFQCSDTLFVNHRPSLLTFQANTYGPDRLPTGPNDIYWHFLKIREGASQIARMRADFMHMKIHDE